MEGGRKKEMVVAREVRREAARVREIGDGAVSGKERRKSMTDQKISSKIYIS